MIERIVRWLCTKRIANGEYEIVDERKLEEYRKYAGQMSDKTLVFMHKREIKILEEFILANTDDRDTLRLTPWGRDKYNNMMTLNLAFHEEREKRSLPYDQKENDQ